MESWIKVDFVIVLLCVVLSRFTIKLIRVLNITRKIAGPTFYELITVHAKYMLSREFLPYMLNLCAEHGHKPVGFWLAHNFTVLISDPESVKDVYKKTTKKASAVYGPLMSYLGKPSLVLNGKRWRHHRNIVNLMFHRTIMEKRRRIYNEEVEDLAKEILREKPLNQEVEIDSLIETRIVRAILRGLTSDTFTFKDIPQYCRDKSLGMKAVQIHVMNPLQRWFGRYLPRGRRAESAVMQAIKNYKTQFAELRKTAVDYYKNKEYNPSDSLDVLLRGNLKTGDVFNEEEFCDELLLLIVGQETTAHTTVLALLLLSIHQEAQQRVFEETESIFGQSHREITTEDLGKMVYLDLVIKETLRLFPVVPFVAKQIEKKTEINGTLLPKGTAIINLISLHRNPKNFKDPLKFDPERFMPEAFREQHPFGYLPFSYGERNCPGGRQGIMAIKIFITILLRNFKILPADNVKCVQDIKVKMCVVVQAYDSMVKFVRRYKEEPSFNTMTDSIRLSIAKVVLIPKIKGSLRYKDLRSVNVLPTECD